MLDKEGLVSLLSTYILEETAQHGSTSVYDVLAKALCEAITLPASKLDEYWLGYLSSQLYDVTQDPSGRGDDEYCHQIEVEVGEMLDIPPVQLQIADFPVAIPAL